jgi:hypothetical protein
MRAIRSIRLLKASVERTLASWSTDGGFFMNTQLNFGSLDDVLSAVVLFVPVSLISAAFALIVIA